MREQQDWERRLWAFVSQPGQEPSPGNTPIKDNQCNRSCDGEFQFRSDFQLRSDLQFKPDFQFSSDLFVKDTPLLEQEPDEIAKECSAGFRALENASLFGTPRPIPTERQIKQESSTPRTKWADFNSLSYSEKSWDTCLTPPTPQSLRAKARNRYPGSDASPRRSKSTSGSSSNVRRESVPESRSSATSEIRPYEFGSHAGSANAVGARTTSAPPLLYQKPDQMLSDYSQGSSQTTSRGTSDSCNQPLLANGSGLFRPGTDAFKLLFAGCDVRKRFEDDSSRIKDGASRFKDDTSQCSANTSKLLRCERKFGSDRAKIESLINELSLLTLETAPDKCAELSAELMESFFCVQHFKMYRGKSILKLIESGRKRCLGDGRGVDELHSCKQTMTYVHSMSKGHS